MCCFGQPQWPFLRGLLEVYSIWKFYTPLLLNQIGKMTEVACYMEFGMTRLIGDKHYIYMDEINLCSAHNTCINRATKWRIVMQHHSENSPCSSSSALHSITSHQNLWIIYVIVLTRWTIEDFVRLSRVKWGSTVIGSSFGTLSLLTRTP